MDQLTAPQLEPRVEGVSPRTQIPGRKRLVWPWIVAAIIIGGLLYLRSNRNNSHAQRAVSADKGSDPASGKGASSIPVIVATAQRGDLPVYFNGLGTVTAFNTVTVRSRVDGQLIKVDFKEGQFVQKGQLLAEIDPRPYQVQLEQAQGVLAKDQAQRKDAEVNLERYKALFAAGVIAKQQLDTQASQVGQVEGTLRNDEGAIDSAKLQLTYSRITAPISGRVGLRLVDSGNMIHAADPNGLLVITQLQPISVIFSLPQDQLPQVYGKLRSGPELVVDAFDRDNTTKIAAGKLVTIDNEIDPTTGTYKLKSIFTNENNVLFPNQFVNVHLLVDTKKNLAIVPTPAIQRGPDGTYVFVAGNDGIVKSRHVTVAETVGNSTGISSGVEPGEVVVIDGQDKLQDGSKIKPTPAPSSPAAPPSNPAVQAGGRRGVSGAAATGKSPR
ncbi:MAG: MdtA/MuxA family multidrug efflux RND transporter periplasmic adaptor subunit [Acidipila sp.]|nr:MdtA/MuxA family multidrug efflux RND transporter periplasmic adaptor subunit [Acidipila sp.]